MEITVRLTKDAEVRTAGKREVVGLNGVINKTIKTKAGDVKKIATFFDCSYWRSTKVAEFLTKGTVVQLSGDIGINAYTSKSGEARANLTFHINEILSWHRTAQKNTNSNEAPDDLPF